MVINPNNASIFIGNTFTFTALSYDTNNQPLATSFNWSLNVSSMGSLDSTIGQSVIFTAESVGFVKLTVNASYGDVFKRAIALITISGLSIETFMIRGKVIDSDNNPVINATVILESTDGKYHSETVTNEGYLNF